MTVLHLGICCCLSTLEWLKQQIKVKLCQILGYIITSLAFIQSVVDFLEKQRSHNNVETFKSSCFVACEHCYSG